MKNLLLAHARTVVSPANQHVPGIKTLTAFFDIYRTGVIPIDRTNTFRTPVRSTMLFPMPTFRIHKGTYEDACNARATEIIQRAETLDCPIFSFWSGGIDSTCVLVSLLKNSTQQQRERITVLMSEDSIAENPNFYAEHIHGKVRHDSAGMFPYMLGSERIFVNGEHNDQLFGSDIVAAFINRFGAAIIHQPFARDTILTFFTERTKDVAMAVFYLELFERLKAVAPVPIETNYDFFWWINFATKWQSVYMRTLTYTAPRNLHLINKTYLDKYYAPFFNTEEFQLWSMNNPDKKIKDTWKTYKWAAKELIYEYTKDAEYRDNKIKRGSLVMLTDQQKPSPFITDTFQFPQTLAPEEYCDPENDFV